MMFLQHEDVEDVIRLRQMVMHAADQHAPAYNPKALLDLENAVHTRATLLALTLTSTDVDNFRLLVDVIEQLTSEVAGARDAVEHERALRRLQ